MSRRSVLGAIVAGVALAPLVASTTPSLASNVAGAGLAGTVAGAAGWRVIGRAEEPSLVLVVASRQRATALAVRVRVSGRPKTAQLHTVVTCSKASPLGIGVYARKDYFNVSAPATRVLPLPVRHPASCGVTAVGMSNGVLRHVGDTVYAGRITVEILALCTARRNRACV